MNIIHIFTSVKRQSFSDLAKAIERKRHSESGYLAIAQSLDEALDLLEESLPSKKKNAAWHVPEIGAMGTYHREHVPDIAISGTYYSVITISVVLFIGSTEWLRNKSKSLLFT